MQKGCPLLHQYTAHRRGTSPWLGVSLSWGCVSKERGFPPSTRNLHGKEKLQSLQLSLLLQHQIFLGLSSLSLSLFPTSFHLVLPWRMKCQFHSSCRLNRFWSWWMVRISYPSFSKHRPCLVLDVSLARDWQLERGNWKGGWQCPAEMLFQFLGWNQQPWEGLKDFGAESCPQAGRGMNAHLSACSCFPKAPRERRFIHDSCFCLWLCFEGWRNLCNLKGKVRNESIQYMLWHNLFLSEVLLLDFILVLPHARSGTSAVWLAWVCSWDAEVSRSLCLVWVSESPCALVAYSRYYW